MLKFLPLISIRMIAFGGIGYAHVCCGSIQIDRIIKVRRKCWRNRLDQIWSRWRLLDPIGLQHVLYTVEYARSRELGYYAQKAMAIALGAVVDVDIGRGQAI
jgi:hypothetical protein